MITATAIEVPASKIFSGVRDDLRAIRALPRFASALSHAVAWRDGVLEPGVLDFDTAVHHHFQTGG